MPTAFLTASTFEVLPFLGTPGAATVGHALVWSESPKGFTLSPISVGPDQFSGVLPVSKGGWGGNTGSFTSPGAITLEAGGTNQNINLQPSGNGSLNFGSVANPTTGNFYLPSGDAESGFNVTLPPSSSSSRRGIYLRKGDGYFAAVNGTGHPTQIAPVFIGKDTGQGNGALAFVGINISETPFTGMYFSSRNADNTGGIATSSRAFYFENGYPGGVSSASCLSIFGDGASIFHSTTESTSATTGAVVIGGGLGAAKNVNIGGNLRFAGGTVPATATSAGTTGDIRYDGSHLYICTATNTWVRTALSTW